MNNLPGPTDFCLTAALYQEFTYELGEGKEAIYALEDFTGPLDAPCTECDQPSVFIASSKENGRLPFSGQVSKPPKRIPLTGGILVSEFICTRQPQHKIEFVFLFQVNRPFANGGTVTKIGQYPSTATLASREIARYRKVLSKDFVELSKAVGLFAHGIGIGSFVYLRRIFENLIEEARQEAHQQPGWDAEQYTKSRMAEKVQLLKGFLPEFVVNNSNLYSILSKGIHELTEEECLAYFPFVRVGIELILDAKLEEVEKRRKLANVAQALAGIHGKLQGS